MKLWKEKRGFEFVVVSGAVLSAVAPSYADTVSPPATVSAGGAAAAAPAAGPSAAQFQALQDKLTDLQRQLDALKAANGGAVPADAAARLQKELDDLKAAVTTATAKPVTVGSGKLNIGGTIQLWAGAATHPDTTYTRINGSGFRLRRSQFALDGSVDPQLGYHVMVDFARSTSTVSTNGMLQDLYLDQSLGHGQELIFGQLKLPFGESSLLPGSRTPAIERPLFIVGQRTIGSVNPAAAIAATGTTPAQAAVPGIAASPVPQWGDIREAQIQYRKTDPRYTVLMAVSEGAGDYQNLVDTKYGKQFTGEIFLRPTGPSGVQLGVTGSGGAGYFFQPPKPSVGAAPAGVNLARTRLGGSFLWNPGRWLIESEYMAGADGVGVTPAGVTGSSGAGHAITAIRHGEYGLLGYDLGGYKKGNGYQLIAMEDYWDPGVGNPHETNSILGFNHDMDGGHRRLQVNYVHEHFDGVNIPSARDIDELILAAIVTW